MDMLPWFLGEKFVETGIYLPAGEGKIGFALRSEMAEAAACILLSEKHNNQEYSISGTESISFNEVAGILSRITGKTINYYSPSLNDYISTLTKAGVPAEYAQMFAAFAQAAKEGDFAAGHTNLEQLLGKRPTSVELFLQKLYVQSA